MELKALQFIKKNINFCFLTLLMMSMANLLFMHYQFLLTIGLESGPNNWGPIDNLLACLIDVSVLLLISWLLTCCRLRIALAITFVVTLLWSFSNIFYSRYFFRYLSISAIGQVGNMTDSTVTNSLLDGFQAIDLFYLVIALLFCYLYKCKRNCDVKQKSIPTIGALWLCVLSMVIGIHSCYAFYHKNSLLYELEKSVFSSSLDDTLWPNSTVYHKGFIRKLFVDPLTHSVSSRQQLSEEQKSEIEKEYTDFSQRVTHRTIPENVKNTIFILVESYMTSLIDQVIEGKEITPNLNKLKRDSTIYYNGNMCPNVSIGRSSDGQLIYMCGLLPLRSEITVSKAKNITLIGLPELMKEANPNLYSYTIIPNTPTFWEQQSMTAEYGFDRLFSIVDYEAETGSHVSGSCLNDKQVFFYATQKDRHNKKPFLSLILTVSTHQPYNKYEECGFNITDNSLPQKYKNYLINCHYADIQIGKYLDWLRQSGLYDNSLIVITSDHEPPFNFMDMDGKLSKDLPLFIINGGITNEDTWNGECNQLDVFTTILDILGIESQWRGLGHTLLNKNYKNSVTEKKQMMSEWIINSDYFSEKSP